MCNHNCNQGRNCDCVVTRCHKLIVYGQLPHTCDDKIQNLTKWFTGNWFTKMVNESGPYLYFEFKQPGLFGWFKQPFYIREDFLEVVDVDHIRTKNH